MDLRTIDPQCPMVDVSTIDLGFLHISSNRVDSLLMMGVESADRLALEEVDGTKLRLSH